MENLCSAGKTQREDLIVFILNLHGIRHCEKLRTGTGKSVMKPLNSSYIRFTAIIAFFSLFCGCANREALRSDYSGYSDVYGAANNKQLLLNLAREEHEEPIYFVQLASISSQYQFAAGAGLSPSGSRVAGMAGAVTRTLSLGGSLTGNVTETPIFQFAPLTGTNLTGALLSPISDRTFFAFYDQGWRADWLARIMLQSVIETNGTSAEVWVNDPNSPTYPEFLEFCHSLYNAQKYNRIVLDTAGSHSNIVYQGKGPKLSDIVNAVAAGLKVTQQEQTTIVNQASQSLSLVKTNLTLSEEVALLSKLRYLDWQTVVLCSNYAALLTGPDAQNAQMESAQLWSYFAAPQYVTNLEVADYIEATTALNTVLTNKTNADITSLRELCANRQEYSVDNFDHFIQIESTKYKCFSGGVLPTNRDDIGQVLGANMKCLFSTNQIQAGGQAVTNSRFVALTNDEMSVQSQVAANADYINAKSNLVLYTALFYVTNMDSKYPDLAKRAQLTASDKCYQMSRRVLALHWADRLADEIHGITFKMRNFEAIMYGVANEQRSFEYQAIHSGAFDGDIAFTNSPYGTIATVTGDNGLTLSVRPILMVRYKPKQRATLQKVAEVDHDGIPYTIGDLEGENENKDLERSLIYRNEPNPYQNRQVFTILSYLFLETGINNQNFPVQQLIQVQ